MRARVRARVRVRVRMCVRVGARTTRARARVAIGGAKLKKEAHGGARKRTKDDIAAAKAS